MPTTSDRSAIPPSSTAPSFRLVPYRLLRQLPIASPTASASDVKKMLRICCWLTGQLYQLAAALSMNPVPSAQRHYSLRQNGASRWA